MIPGTFLVERSAQLDAELDSLDGRPTPGLSDIRAFIEELQQAGAATAEQNQRELLRSLLDYWAGVLTEITGSVVLAPRLERFRDRREVPDELTPVTPAKFRELIHQGVRIISVLLESGDFTDSPLTFRNALINCRLTKCHLEGSTLEGVTLTSTTFAECFLDGVKARNVTATDCKFENTNLPSADFREAIVAHTEFSHVNLGSIRGRKLNTVFSEADLSWSRFENVKGTGSFIDTTLRSAKLDSNVVLDGSNFAGANLKGAVAQDTSFRNTDFTGADFRARDLSADFHGATLTDANFLGARGLKPEMFDSENWHDALGLSSDLKRALKKKYPTRRSSKPGAVTGAGEPYENDDRGNVTDIRRRRTSAK